MSRHVRGVAACVALCAAAARPAPSAEIDLTEWSHRADIEAEALSEKGLVEFELTSEVHDLARADLADLRVVAGTGDEMDYVLRRSEGRSRREALKVRLYDRTCVPGERSSVTAEFENVGTQRPSYGLARYADRLRAEGVTVARLGEASEEAGPAGAEEAGGGERSHRAAVVVAALPEKGLVEFALTSEVHDLARADLADLRVVDETGDEVGYVLRRAEGRQRRERLDVRLYNRTFVPARQSSVTADFGEKVLKNRIEIETGGTDFRREVLVEGSDDGTSWRAVRKGAFLFRVARGPAGAGYDKTAVSLPDNDHRYLRVTVYHGPDDVGVEIGQVRAWRLVAELPETAPVPVCGSEVVHRDDGRATEVTFDLGFRNLPLHELALDLADADFFRQVSVAGRNTRGGSMSARGSARGEETPWRSVGSAAIWRCSAGGSADESVVIGLGGAGYRYVRVRVENGDDAPLGFEGASVSRLVQYAAFQPKKGGSYALCFGEKALKNRVEIVTTGTRFRREVLLEGSDDGAGWGVVREGAFLFKIPRGPEGEGYDKSVVAMPDNDQRYLRITVSAEPEGPPLVEVKDVKAWLLVREPPETAPVPVLESEVVEDEKERATYVTLDLGHRNLPLHEVRLAFRGGEFFRHVSVSGRNAKELVVPRRMEDGSVVEKRTEAPWTDIASGVVYRWSARRRPSGFGALATAGGAEEALSLDLEGAQYRYLRVRVENRDDPPLAFSGASVSRLVQHVAFWSKGAGPWRLYVGNPGARRPRYDLADYAARLRAEGVRRSRLGAVGENPAYGRAERPVPWSERHRWLLWAALVAIGAVLALLVYRQAKTGPAPDEGPSGRGTSDGGGKA
jgi:hypothetical protein